MFTPQILMLRSDLWWCLIFLAPSALAGLNVEGGPAVSFEALDPEGPAACWQGIIRQPFFQGSSFRLTLKNHLTSWWAEALDITNFMPLPCFSLLLYNVFSICYHPIISTRGHLLTKNVQKLKSGWSRACLAVMYLGVKRGKTLMFNY